MSVPNFKVVTGRQRSNYRRQGYFRCFATFGFGMIGFFRALRQATQSEESVRLHQGAIHMGVALVVLGLVAITVAALYHWVALRRLRRGEQAFITPWPLSITIAIFVAVLGLYGLWSLLVP